MATPMLAIIGAGPIGLEAALEAISRGFRVRVYEAARVGEHLRRFGHVTLFTPFGMNATAAGRRRLARARVPLPREDALLTAGQLAERYLQPLAELPELSGSIHEGARVTHVGRAGLSKRDAIGAVGDRRRLDRPFLLRIETTDRGTTFETADVVLDASGVYSNPQATGPGGLPALGEERLGEDVLRHLAPSIGMPEGPCATGVSLLIGDGHSAATALVLLDDLARTDRRARRIHWIRRDRGERPFVEVPNDPLPARLELARRANHIAGTAPWLTHHAGASVTAYERRSNGRIHVTLAPPGGDLAATDRIEVDRVLALTGYRPDVEMTRELQVHLCYASEAPMKLASAVLSAGVASAERAGDCLSQISHGAESLRNPEPGFFILGAKSYGRNPTFLLTLGHRQIEEVFQLISAETSPQTGARTIAG